ncbi:MAG: sensor histidine kinase [Bythopirellula sp.]
MMFRSNSDLGFPRKLVVYYLLFCLVAVSWLAMGMLFTSHSVMELRTTSTSLSQLGKTAAALELEYLRTGVENLQQVLLKNHNSVGSCEYSVVSLEGTVLAHSNANSIGNTASDHAGKQLRFGNVSGVQYEGEQGTIINQYQVPLVAHEDHFGSLRISVPQLNFWSTLAEIVRLAPVVVLVPLGLIAAGGLYLARLASPLAQVDTQLRNIALERPTVDFQLQPLPAIDAISMGWNRVVGLFEQNNASNTGEDLRNRLAEVVASRTESEMQVALNNLSEGIAVTDIAGRITFANRAIAALLGTETSSEELAGIELQGQIVKASGEAASAEVFAEAPEHRALVTEIEREGESDQRTLRIARLPMEDETIRGHVWSVRDVTQQKLTEKTRDQFIDVATHELRTPLSNIKAYAETLATCDEIEVEQQKEFCNIINSEVTRLARFVDDLLSISSMEAGSIAIQRQRTITAKLFEEVLAKVQPLMKKKDIALDVHLPEKMADLQIDKDKIVAVLVNMLGNAAKYTPAKGRVTLRVKIDDAQLHISVEDTGMGIAPDELPKVFDKFFRSNDPRVQGETGTGLGLSLAREVLRIHGGEITVESVVDQGTTFVATIPIR